MMLAIVFPRRLKHGWQKPRKWGYGKRGSSQRTFIFSFFFSFSSEHWLSAVPQYNLRIHFKEQVSSGFRWENFIKRSIFPINRMHLLPLFVFVFLTLGCFNTSAILHRLTSHGREPEISERVWINSYSKTTDLSGPTRHGRIHTLSSTCCRPECCFPCNRVK